MSGAGRVCAVHGEWCPDGVCRWCDPAVTPPAPAEIRPHVCTLTRNWLRNGEKERRRCDPASAAETERWPPRSYLGKALGPLLDMVGKPVRFPQPTPVRPSPVVDCFCGGFHFSSQLIPPLRDVDGALHTPDACGRFTPSPSRYVDVRFTVGDGSTKAEVVPVADPEHPLRPWDPAEALRLLRGCLAPAPDITPLVPCSCGAYSFVPASYAPGTPLRSRESNGDFHAPEACLDRAGHELPPSARAALVPCSCGARKVPAGQELSLLDVAVANDRHSADYCIDAAGRTYGHTAPDLEHP